MTESDIKKGLAGVVVDYTAISKVNPETNSLLYRGYPVQELAATQPFEAVAYLLWNGELPSEDQLAALRADDFAFPSYRETGVVNARGASPEGFLRAWRGEAARARPKGQMAGLLGLPRWLAKRTSVKRSRQVSNAYLESLLTDVNGHVKKASEVHG